MEDLFRRAITAIVYVSVFIVLSLLCLTGVRFAWWLFMAVMAL